MTYSYGWKNLLSTKNTLYNESSIASVKVFRLSEEKVQMYSYLKEEMKYAGNDEYIGKQNIIFFFFILNYLKDMVT